MGHRYATNERFSVPCFFVARPPQSVRTCGWTVGLLILLAGCRDASRETYPVTGKLTIRGKPAEAADLRFYEIRGQVAGMARPYARTDE
jgi:hypothetical protein